MSENKQESTASMLSTVERRKGVKRVRKSVTLGEDVVKALERVAASMPVGLRDRMVSRYVDALLSAGLGL